MDFTIDNNKSSEIDNVTQTLLSNANGDTKLKTDDANGLFEMTGNHHHQLNDGLNNFIGLHHTGENPFSDIVGKGVVTEHDLFLAGEKDHVTMSNAEKACLLENEGDMGPETSVDTTDDVDIDTDPCSTLSHSKETIPSDNPFDSKFSTHDFDADEFVHGQQEKSTAPVTPSNPMTFEDEFNDPMGMQEPMEFNIPSEIVAQHASDEVAFLGEEHTKTEADAIDEIKDNEQSSLKFIGDYGMNIVDKPSDMGDFVTEVVERIETTVVETTNRGLENILEDKDDFPEKHLSQITEEIVTTTIETEQPEVVKQEIDHYLEHEAHDIEFKEDDETKSVSPVPGDYHDHSDDSIRHNEEIREIDYDHQQQQQFDETHVDEPQRHDYEFYMDKESQDQFEPSNEPIDTMSENKFDNDLLNENFTQKEIVDIMQSQGIVDENVMQDHKKHMNESADLFETEQSQEVHKQIETNLENLLSNNDGNIEIDFVESHSKEEKTKNDELPSLESNEPHIEAENLANEEKEFDVKDQDTFQQIKTNELESAVEQAEQESCDESLDEWNYIKAKDEDRKETEHKIVDEHVDVVEEKLEPEEQKEQQHAEQHVPNESQEAEDLKNKKEAEAEKTLESSSIENVVGAVAAAAAVATLSSPVPESLHDKDDNDNEPKSLENLEDDEDMNSQLNPEAQEFVPSSSPISFELKPNFILTPQGLNGDDIIAQSPRKGVFSMDGIELPPENQFDREIANRPAEIEVGDNLRQGLNMAPVLPGLAHCLNGDDLIAQSPRKGGSPMDDIPVPSENEFDLEIAMRPSEISEIESYEPTLKEVMHQPEKEQASPNEPFDNTTLESADMRSSIYDTTLGKIEDVMNKVQLLPNDNDERSDIGADDSTVTNRSFLMDKNLNGDGTIVSDLSQLKLEETTKAVAEEAAAQKKASGKLSKTPELKKTDSKSKTVAVGPKKVASSTSANLSDASKPKTATTLSKTKVAAASLSARPRTAPVASSKPPSAEKKSTNNLISARARPDTKSSPTGLKKAPLTRPRTEESAKPAARPTTASKVASTTKTLLTTRTASTTSTTTSTAKRTPISNTSSASSTTKPTSQRLALSPNSKPISSTTKPSISPRSTVTSTLRKTEAVKDPIAGTRTTTTTKTTTTTAARTVPKPTTTTHRTSGGTTTATKRPLGSQSSSTTTTTAKTTTIKKSTLSTKSAATKKPIKKETGGSLTPKAVNKRDHIITAPPAPTETTSAATEDLVEIKMNGTAVMDQPTNLIPVTNGENAV